MCLGGLKISDAFGMMETGAGKWLCGLPYSPVALPATSCSWPRAMTWARRTLGYQRRVSRRVYRTGKRVPGDYGDKIICPVDLAYERDGQRQEISIEDLQSMKAMWISEAETIKIYEKGEP